MANQDVYPQQYQVLENQRKHYLYYTRNYVAVGVMWGIFHICFTIINIVVFVQPQWIGDTEDSVGIGYFGLYERCELFTGNSQELVRDCKGEFNDFSTIISAPFKASTFFIGISCLFVLIAILCFLLFAFVKPDHVFYGIGCVQFLSGICMFLGCVIYPAGWDHPEVKRLCGFESDKYFIGNCMIRWAYILAIIGIFDILILAILAFVLASRYARRRDYYYGTNITKSELNGGNTLDTASGLSKPSMIIQPVLAVQEPSEYSTARRSRKGDFSL